MNYAASVLRKLVREIHRTARAASPAHSHLRDRLVAIVLATVGVNLISAVLALWFEKGAPHTQITNFGDAIFWTSTQLLTVSSQLPNPISTPGRILDVFMEAYAITVVASLAASLGAFSFRRALEFERAASRAEHGAMGHPPPST